MKNIEHELLTIEEERILLAGDFHVPFHHEETVAALLETRGYPALAILGDFNNCEFLSPFSPSYPYPWKLECEESKRLWRELGKKFRRIYAIPGNHSFRLNRKTNNEWGFQELLRVTLPEDGRGVLHSTNRHYMSLTNGKRQWLLCHPREYSRVVGRVAERLMERWNMNIIAAHSHYGSLTIVWMGHEQLAACDSFCMCNSDKLQYVRDFATTHPRFINGFVGLQEGNIEVYTQAAVSEYRSGWKEKGHLGTFGKEVWIWS